MRKCALRNIRTAPCWFFFWQKRIGKALFRIREVRVRESEPACSGDPDWNSSSARLIKCIRLRISCVLFKEDKINFILNFCCSELNMGSPSGCAICFLEIVSPPPLQNGKKFKGLCTRAKPDWFFLIRGSNMPALISLASRFFWDSVRSERGADLYKVLPPAPLSEGAGEPKVTAEPEVEEAV